MTGIPAQHFLVQELLFCHILPWNGVFWSTESLITAFWCQETKFQYDKQSRGNEWISERWSCASNYHHACEIPFTKITGLQLNMSVCQRLYFCNVVWTERNSLCFFSVDSLCLSRLQTAHPQTTHNPFTDCLIHIAHEYDMDYTAVIGQCEGIVEGRWWYVQPVEWFDNYRSLALIRWKENLCLQKTEPKGHTCSENKIGPRTGPCGTPQFKVA